MSKNIHANPTLMFMNPNVLLVVELNLLDNALNDIRPARNCTIAVIPISSLLPYDFNTDTFFSNGVI